MWNHTQPQPGSADTMTLNSQELTYEQKLQKLLDISPYLQYLEKLFNQPSSDSESSDSETEQLGNHMWNASTWPSSNNTEPKPNKAAAPSSSSSSSESTQSLRGSSPFSSASTLSSTSSSTSSSSTSSSSSSDSEANLPSQNGTSSSTTGNPFNLPPISDSELQNLFKVHKSWKKSSHPLGSQADIMSLLNASQSSKRSSCSASSNKSSKKSRRISSVPSSSKRPRKQSMKNVKKETEPPKAPDPLPPPPPPPQPVVAPAIPIPIPIVIKEEQEPPEVEIKTELFETLEAKPHVVPPLGNFMEGEDDDDDDEDEDDEEDDEDSSESEDEDDNDSLSDFVSMAAAAQTGSSQILSAAAAKNHHNIVFKSVTSKAPMAGSSGQPVGGKKLKKDFNKKKISPQKHAKLIQVLNMKRRKVYVLLCKKEIGKTQRARTNIHKENVAIKRRLAQACSRILRQRAIQSQKVMKESVWRAKRLTREMLAYWKQADRVEREVRKRREKEAEEQRKFDVELMEAKRQQRKLNFLITQTELYAHFMSKKLGTSGGGGQGGQQGLKEKDEMEILSQLNEEKDGRLARIDDYDVEAMKRKAKQNVENAFQTQLSQVKFFDLDAIPEDFLTDLKLESTSLEFQQPKMFEGILKHYQLKGLNWLASLYDQGINGILADEMGLGKTVQSMAFLAHVAERYGVWGPFLIIAPASTLHNWQQEFKRFVPNFKVVPYWGTPQERKILRQFWQQGNLHTEEASFHVVITSYQIVMTDIKYFNRIKWQYLILDEAQAIKSSTSARWKMLLGFSCRNRLLLTGTPIQNTMAELWALLHFIMPSLFDSHEEFNEWFSKDIESHAENKSLIDEKHLGRLHLILKPFMLRRIKKDVENELSDKVEVLVHCPLTSRQRQLYTALKKKIRIEDLVKSSSNSQLAQHATTNLMNLVMQFRKVCNHPDLFERRKIQSPHLFPPIVVQYPRRIFREVLECPSQELFKRKLSIFNPQSLHSALKNQEPNWSFARFIGLSVGEIYTCAHGETFQILKLLVRLKLKLSLLQHARNWAGTSSFRALDLLWPGKISPDDLRSSALLQDLVFVKPSSSLYTFKSHHQKIKNKSAPQLEATYLPPFLYYNNSSKIQAPCPRIYFSDRSAAWKDEERLNFGSEDEKVFVLNGKMEESEREWNFLVEEAEGGLEGNRPVHGWSGVVVPAKEKLISDSGKLGVLDVLLQRLKSNSHRVLIYSQMTKQIDILEEYMCLRKWTYMRLDGSSKISERRDMVADFQSRADIFVFLLSTRAGGLGINLTAADVVIFYDSDWNPTVDQQAMDRAHRLGQTKQVYVYRLICKGTIEERILQRAREKNEIQRMVISGGHFRPDTLKPKEVVSLLLDDEELEKKYRQKQAERRMDDAKTGDKNKDGKLISLKRKRVEKAEDGGTEDSPGLAKEASEDATGSEVVLEGELTDEEDEGSSSSVSSKDDEPPSPGLLTGQESSMSSHFKTIEWNADSISDYEGEFAVLPKRPKVGRGTGKRGRPPSRVRLPTRDPEGSGDSSVRRGPGRPRLRPVGPANQGVRGRRPGRPPLSRKASDSVQPSTSSAAAPPPPVTSSSAIPTTSLTPLTASQKVFGFYSSPDIDIV